MSVNFEPKARTIGEVLGNTRLEVPDWQRPFAWKEPQIEAFWNDLAAFSDQYPGENVEDRQYFLGSIVFIGSSAPYEVLDGQQRLATSVILLSVIRDYLKDVDPKASTTIQTTFIVSYNIAAQTERDNLVLNRFDRDFFSNRIAREASPQASASLTSHKDILAARAFFVKALEGKRTALGSSAFADLCRRLQSILCEHCTVIQIVSEDEDAAALIFETLNDRGLSLSTVDLLRNFLLRRSKQEDLDLINAAWEDILEYAGTFDVSQFLRHYWTSKHGDVKSQGLFKEIKTKLTESSTDFSLHLQEAAEDYADLVNGRSSNDDLKRIYQDINLLDATILYPALLSANSVFGETQNRDD
jgi:uncharacterized protein with ParB-like and HNH nuclease domain